MRYDKELLTAEEHSHRNLVRSVYKIGYGQTELFHVLTDAGCFRIIQPEELDARNRAIMKAEELGMLDEHVIKGFIRSFFEMDFEKTEKERIKNTVMEDDKPLYPDNI